MPRRFRTSAPTMAVRTACPTPCGTWLGYLTSTPAPGISPRRLYSELMGSGGNNAPVPHLLSAALPKASTARIILSCASRSLSTLQQWRYLRLITLEPSSRSWPAHTTPSPRIQQLMSGKGNHLSLKSIIRHSHCLT